MFLLDMNLPDFPRILLDKSCIFALMENIEDCLSIVESYLSSVFQ